MSGDTLGCQSWGMGGTVVARSGRRLEVLISIPHCAGQPLTTKNYLAQNVNSAKAKKP